MSTTWRKTGTFSWLRDPSAKVSDENRTVVWNDDDNNDNDDDNDGDEIRVWVVQD